MPLSRLEKAHSQRMYFLQTLPPTTRSISFLMAGASGNVYTVTIPQRAAPSAAAHEEERLRCNCVDHVIRKSVCKHMLFICLRVLRFSAAELDELERRKCIAEGRLSTALDAIHAGLVDARFRASSQLQGAFASAAGALGGERVPKRMPDADETCPVCCDELKHEDELAHCLYGCGKALHHECFERYAKSHRERVRRGEVDGDDALRCVFCRAAWEPKRVGRRGLLAGRRLINLADGRTEMFEMGAVRRTPTSGGKRRRKKDAVGAGAAGSSGVMTRSRAKRRRNC